MVTLKTIYMAAAHNKIIQLVIIAVIVDTLFGMMRAAKSHELNSCFGINGAIRKCGMIFSIMFLVMVDYITGFNMIGFLPETIRQHIGNQIAFQAFCIVIHCV